MQTARAIQVRDSPVPSTDLVWRGYVHPLPLGAMALLVLNDHVLKTSTAPGWLTGKLSDVVGLFAFPLLLAAAWALLRSLAGRHGSPTRAELAGCCLTTGALFTLLQLSAPVAGVWLTLSESLGGLVGVGASVTMDPSDLLTLPALWLSWAHGRRFARMPAARMPAARMPAGAVGRAREGRAMETTSCRHPNHPPEHGRDAACPMLAGAGRTTS